LHIIRNVYVQAFIVSFGVLCVYLSFLHLNIAHAHDAPDYYHRIITEKPSWHAHHVLYEPLSWLWLEYTKYITPWVHPFKLASAMNSFFGAGCIFIIYLICRLRLDLFAYHSIITSCAIAFTFYYFNYSTTVEVYHVALFFTLLTFLYATTDKELDAKDMMWIGIFHGLAMSFHQMHFLLGFVLLHRLYQAGFARFCLYLLSGTIIVVGTYSLAAYVQDIHTFDDFLKYFMGYMANEKIVADSSSPMLAPFGLGMALLGGRYLMAVEPVAGFIKNHFADSMFERILILHHKTDIINGTVQIALYVLFVILMVCIAIRYYKNISKFIVREQKEFYLFIAIYSLFFIFWYPHNPEFWGAPLTFMILVCFDRIKNIRLLLAMTVTIFGINLLGSAIPLLDPDNNLYPNGIESLF
jgi:hypothetical protein